MDKPNEVEQKFVRPGVEIDLPEILQKGKITVLAENSSTTYFYYKGKEMGFEFELLKIFADEIGVELEIKVDLVSRLIMPESSLRKKALLVK